MHECIRTAHPPFKVTLDMIKKSDPLNTYPYKNQNIFRFLELLSVGKKVAKISPTFSKISLLRFVKSLLVVLNWYPHRLM